MRVLIIEDDDTIGELLSRVLGEDGATSTWVQSAQAGVARASEGYDVIVLDWMLPDQDGPWVVETLRKANVLTPILMLTARGELSDRVRGLRSGADDYLTKPFEVEELLARLHALVRRSAQLSQIVAGELSIDRLQRQCRVSGTPVDLTPREYELLVRIASAAGAAVSRSDLLRDVWRLEFDPGSGLLDVQISRLREKLGDSAFRLETVRGVGYRLRSDP